MRRSAASGLFDRFLAEAEAELRTLRRLHRDTPAARAVKDMADPSSGAQQLLREKIVEQQHLVEKMRSYVATPGN
jgi:hypothetical protein